MKYFIFGIVMLFLAWFTSGAHADHVSNRALEGKELLAQAPCVEQSTGRSGLCEIYEGGYLAFWTDSNTIAWVKDADGNIVYMDGEVEAQKVEV